MEVSHNDKAYASNHKPPEFNTGIRGDAAGEIVRDLAVKENDTAAGSKN